MISTDHVCYVLAPTLPAFSLSDADALVGVGSGNPHGFVEGRIPLIAFVAPGGAGGKGGIIPHPQQARKPVDVWRALSP